MKYRIKHITEYHYSEPVQLCRNQASLLPRSTEFQLCRNSSLKVSPTADDLHERKDFFGNRVTHFALQEPHEKLVVTAQSEVEIIANQALFDATQGKAWDGVRAHLRTVRNPDTLTVLPYLYDSPLVREIPQLVDYASPSFPPGRPLPEAVEELMQRIYQDFRYDPEVTTISTPLQEVLANRHGVCQDFAHLGIGCLRAMGLAARYVSGYIETIPPPGTKRLVGADASHAWFSIFSPGIGWIDFDPTNNQIPAEQHITVAWGRDFSDVSPLKGIALGGGEHTVVVSVDVARLTE
ncbi:transglutaminase family protein [Malonomonas rubra]|uniref:transglutaminase family protein n=1 Tax=Malonomonas rubra TaxID=57040 RepID=UPI0026EBCA44|nr:transglutaminase family protein [Malonomonas rubra]